MNVKPRYLTENFQSCYYNWDRINDRAAALKGEWSLDSKLIILDEFHEHSKWQTWIKGEFDTNIIDKVL